MQPVKLKTETGITNDTKYTQHNTVGNAANKSESLIITYWMNEWNTLNRSCGSITSASLFFY